MDERITYGLGHLMLAIDDRAIPEVVVSVLARGAEKGDSPTEHT